MGLGTERYAAGGITREQQDEVAVKSNERAANAIKDGRLADEITPVSIPQRKRRADPRRDRRGRAARARRWNRSPRCGRRSTRKARSPRPTRHRSATAVARS